jgi:hypothetical protein
MDQQILEPHADAPRNQPRIRIVTTQSGSTLCFEYPDRTSVLYLDDVTLAWLAPRIEELWRLGSAGVL